MILRHYILGGPDGRTPIEEPDLLTWAKWFEGADNRRVALTDLPHGGFVSTVFLGLDHSFRGGPPILFETMSRFGDGDWGDEYFDRYSSWAEAEAGHAAIVQLALQAIEHAAAGMAQALVPADTLEGGR